MLRDELAKWRPELGERLAVKYEGKTQSKSGGTYHSYSVAVADREPPEGDGGINWTKHQPTADTLDEPAQQLGDPGPEEPPTLADGDADIPF